MTDPLRESIHRIMATCESDHEAALVLVARSIFLAGGHDLVKRDACLASAMAAIEATIAEIALDVPQAPASEN
jgi:hypothetical protein